MMPNKKICSLSWMGRLVLPLFAAACVSCAAASPDRAKTPAASPWAAANPSWVEPFEPFRVIGNVYYVGARGLSSFLIVSSQGHFLIDGGLPENAAIIAANIKALGYDVADVRYLLNSHAHLDHSGGLAALKKLSGAELVASEGDRWALENGLVLGSEDDADFAAPPVTVDRIVNDGETLDLGGVALTARITPGHTKGCTSWTMRTDEFDGHPFNVLFFCSASVAANRLVQSKQGPPQYEGIVEDYRATFAKAKNWRPDVFLANHPFLFDMEARRARQQDGVEQAFVDPKAFRDYITEAEAAFMRALAEQTSKSQAR